MSRPRRAAGDDAPTPAGAAPPAFGPATRAWFEAAFERPTSAQVEAWEAIARGEHVLVVAPTGSGKTLAAFLWAIDRLTREPVPERSRRCRILYVSPLKALAADVERNLRSPLVGIGQAAGRLGLAVPELLVGMRTGDTPAAERRSFAGRPPDILITTPESLYLVLTSQAREGLRGVETVIVDEVHAVAGTKRGAHLAVSLERLDELLARPAQRIGLSATVRPTDTVAAFLGGTRTRGEGGRGVSVVQPAMAKTVRIDVVAPVPDLADLPAAGGAEDLSGAAAGALRDPRRAASIWPHVEERLVDLIAAHRSTIVFANSRRGAERLVARVNEVWADRLDAGAGTADGPADPGSSWSASYPGQGGSAAARTPGRDIARAHHGSMSREERGHVESELKAGRLPAVVATSSLELGIDMGAVDLVVQVGSPPSVASALQRVGRAGHAVGAESRGVLLPTHRGDLLAGTVTAVRAGEGAIEALRVPANPLDVAAQQIVATVSVEDRSRDEIARLLRRAAPFAGLGDASLDAVLDMLSGRYPSEDFADLRPRLVWDRGSGRLSARPGAARIAVTSGGTIPDRGLFGVYLAAGADRVAERGGRRVGELDEEMVYESRVGDTFALGSTTWRIEDITPDRVLVSPAPGLPGRLPFWRGDSPGRPAELGGAVGRTVRRLARQSDDDARADLARWGLDAWAADNLIAYLREQAEATGALPDDRTIVVERFRDEIGDWRLVVHSPWGARVHAPWALVLAERLRSRFGSDVQAMHGDDGIVLRIPDAVADPLPPREAAGRPGHPAQAPEGDATTLSGADLLLAADEVRPAVVAALAGSAHFAARFREAASRSLLLPKRRPDRRQPLWQQRQRAAQLLGVAAHHPDFPVVLEAVRECVQDDFDVPALASLMEDVAARRVRVVDVTTPAPSPFARTLLFAYVGQFIYDGDAPLAERRAAALSLDPRLLAELLGEGSADIGDLLDPAAVAQVAAEVGLLLPDRLARTTEDVFDLLRRLGPLTAAEVAVRAAEPDAVGRGLAELTAARRAFASRVAGTEQWAVLEDAARLRDALGVALPPGLPEAVLTPVADPLGDLIRRHARTHGPFVPAEVARRFGLGVAVVKAALQGLESRGILTSGRLRAGSPEVAYCDAEVLRRIRRRSLAALRAEVEPVPQRALADFLVRWQGVGSPAAPAESDDGPPGTGRAGLLAAIEQLAGAAVPASALETLVLPSRVRDYRPALLDELLISGDVVWTGHGSLGPVDGLVVLAPTDLAPLLLPEPDDGAAATPLHRALVVGLAGGGARFTPELAALVAAETGEPVPGDRFDDALWDLVWAGLATSDTFGPLRERLGAGRARHPAAPAPGRPRALRRSALRTAAFRSDRLRAAAPSPGTPQRGSNTPGRWSAPPARGERAARDLAGALALLDRLGVVTRGPTAGLPGGFQAVYRVLARLEETGQVRRGYLVEGLGAAQFALPECVDLLRAAARAPGGPRLLAASDPANPFGAALGWPEPARGVTHRPGRTAGAYVVLLAGEPVLYLERGARTLLTFTGDAGRLAPAAAELAGVARTGALGRFTLRQIDGEPALGGSAPAVEALLRSGFIATPSGLRLSERPRRGAAAHTSGAGLEGGGRAGG